MNKAEFYARYTKRPSEENALNAAKRNKQAQDKIEELLWQREFNKEFGNGK